MQTKNDEHNQICSECARCARLRNVVDQATMAKHPQLWIHELWNILEIVTIEDNDARIPKEEIENVAFVIRKLIASLQVLDKAPSEVITQIDMDVRKPAAPECAICQHCNKRIVAGYLCGVGYFWGEGLFETAYEIIMGANLSQQGFIEQLTNAKWNKNFMINMGKAYGEEDEKPLDCDADF